MKIRDGFVSNSSSSSFLIISWNGVLEKPKLPINNGKLVIDGQLGEKEFGWQFEKYFDFWDKLNFAVMQAQYVNQDQWSQMIKNVISDTYPEITEIEIESLIDTGYIDHQSCASEGENTELFENEETLRNFLFNRYSYIQGGNDNV